MFGGGTPQMPTPPKPIPAPSVDEALAAAANDEELKRKQGRAAQIFTSKDGAIGAPSVAVKTLLGQ